MDFINDLPIVINFLLFALGVLLLVKGSDLFIDSAVYFAKKFHVSEMIIGLTLVSFGTSLPELATNINSAIKGRSAIAMGNVTGSNITNIALVIGLSALIIGKIKVPRKLFIRDMLFMIGTTVLLLVFSYFFDNGGYVINRVESTIMLILLIFYIFYLFNFNKEDVGHEAHEHEKQKIKSMGFAVLLFIGGITLIFLGSEVMVRNIIAIAGKLNISDGVIGATIVALATSLPELSVTIIGILKKNADLSLGNIVGSNIFNILAILGVTGMINEINIFNVLTGTPDQKMLSFTLPFTLFIAIALFIFMAIKMQLGRIKGAIFLLFYAGFIVLNFVQF